MSPATLANHPLHRTWHHEGMLTSPDFLIVESPEGNDCDLFVLDLALFLVQLQPRELRHLNTSHEIYIFYQPGLHIQPVFWGGWIIVQHSCGWSWLFRWSACSFLVEASATLPRFFFMFVWSGFVTTTGFPLSLLLGCWCYKVILAVFELAPREFVRFTVISH